MQYPRIVICTRCGQQMWAGPPDEPQRECALCQKKDERDRSQGCPSCGGSGYVRSEYGLPDGRVIRQTEPCGDCRSR